MNGDAPPGNRDSCPVIRNPRTPGYAHLQIGEFEALCETAEKPPIRKYFLRCCEQVSSVSNNGSLAIRNGATIAPGQHKAIPRANGPHRACFPPAPSTQFHRRRANSENPPFFQLPPEANTRRSKAQLYVCTEAGQKWDRTSTHWPKTKARLSPSSNDDRATTALRGQPAVALMRAQRSAACQIFSDDHKIVALEFLGRAADNR